MTTWVELKVLMKKCFVPSHYHRDLYEKLQNLTQVNRSVEDYYKEIEVSLLRADIVEDRKANMVRFLSGLRPEIADQVEMHQYVEIGDMLEKAIKAGRRLKRSGLMKSTPSPSPSYSSTPKLGVIRELQSAIHLSQNQDIIHQKGKQSQSLSLLMRH